MYHRSLSREDKPVAKNKGTMGKDKAATITAPDEFVSVGGRIVEKLRPHARQLVIGVLVAALLLVAFAVWRWNERRKATAATDLYHRALLIAEIPVIGADAPGDKPAADDVRNLPGFFPDAEARATATLALLDELEREHGGSEVAGEARLVRGSVLLTLGRADDALAAYRGFLAEAEQPTLEVAALEGVGYALEARAMANKDAGAKQAGLEEALRAFEEVQPDDAGYGRDRALYHQGRILAALGKTDEARKRLEAALTRNPGPALKSEIDGRLASLGSAQ